jgi:hypothetical protein
VVVLDELAPDAKLLEDVAPVRLGEEAPLVAMDDRLDEDGTFQAGVESAHGRAPYEIVTVRLAQPQASGTRWRW